MSLGRWLILDLNYEQWHNVTWRSWCIRRIRISLESKSNARCHTATDHILISRIETYYYGWHDVILQDSCNRVLQSDSTSDSSFFRVLLRKKTSLRLSAEIRRIFSRYLFAQFIRPRYIHSQWGYRVKTCSRWCACMQDRRRKKERMAGSAEPT